MKKILRLLILAAMALGLLWLMRDGRAAKVRGAAGRRARYLGDVGPNDAPTKLRAGSHLELPRVLASNSAAGTASPSLRRA